MKHRTANCPGCGGLVEFKTASSLVTICEFCHSAVSRADKKIEDYGKVADVGETSSGLRLGLSGTYHGKHFFITGRVRYQHPAGGVWDEWYLAFPGERWGWLAEAQGKFYLMFARKLSSSITLPSYESVIVASTVKLGSTELFVREKGIATALAADGEIPWAFRPGAEHQFVDLTGADNTFATFEYSNQLQAFTGKEITLAELGVETAGGHPDAETTTVAALKLDCPHCGGALTLRAPDQSERVTCPSCDRLLDCKGGKLEVFRTLKQKHLTPVVPLGREGVIGGKQYTVIGFLGRYATYQGKRYPWTEYLLHHPQLGFRWLVCNEKHWSFVEPVSLETSGIGSTIRYNGTNFRIYDRGTAYVSYVLGEFYWQVNTDEVSTTADYIAPPRMLSLEWTTTTKSQELNVSLGTYMQVDEVEKAFDLKRIARPWGCGPMSPKPQVGFGIYLLWLMFLIALFAIHSLYYTGYPTTGSDPWLLFYGMLGVTLPLICVWIYQYNFEVQRWKDSDFSPYASE